MAKPTWTLDQIVDNLNRNGEFWNGSTISFSFATTMPSEYNGIGLSFGQFSGAQRTAAREAMALWDDVIAVSLTETSSSNSDIQLFNSNLAEVAGAFLPGTVVDGLDVSGDILINPDYYYNGQLNLDDYGFMTMIHEIGHALGLEHPGEYNAGSGGTITYDNSAEYAQDTLKYSVMSYFEASNSNVDHVYGEEMYAASPLLHDIAAIQAAYGADMGTRTGDTTYGFNSNAGRDSFDFTVNRLPVVAIWDADGIDTLDFSGFNIATTIDLREGGFSSTGELTHNVAIAYGAEIENAVGGSAGDSITGNDLDNVLFGGSGNDYIRGLDGANTLYGEAGNDNLVGGYDIDSLWGGVGNDQLSGGSGDDTLWGEDGDDRLEVSSGTNTLLGGLGNDSLIGGAGDDLLDGGTGNDFLTSEFGKNTLIGNSGNDTLKGGFRADSLEGGEGNDTLDGGKAGDVAPENVPLHDDVAIFRGNRDDYEITRDFRGDFTITDLYVLDGDDGTDFLTNVEWFQFNDQRVDASTFEIPDAPDLVINGTDGNDTLSGLTGNDSLYGLAGDDLLHGREGDDLLEGGGGDDYLVGDEGDDLLSGGEGNDRLFGEVGNDRVFGEDGDDWLVGGHGNDTLSGGAGNDQLQGQYGSNLIFGGAGNDLAVGAEGSDTLFGGDGVDTLFGQAGGDTLNGGDGIDTIWGGIGNDTVAGGAGDDVLRGEQGADTFHGGEGDDWIDGEVSGASDVVMYDGNIADYQIFRDHSGGTTVLDLNYANGNEGADYIDGVARLKFLDQEIFTGDLEISSPPDLVINGGGTSELLRGNAGADTISGGAGNDSIYGYAGADTLAGDSGNDLLSGGEGDDTLIGGAGSDTLHGESGLDTALFEGNRQDYWITYGSNGDTYLRYVGTGSYAGNDIVRADVERFQFSDGTWTRGDLPENAIPPDPPVYLKAPSSGGALSGGGGDDVLIGRGGNDKLFGGDGNDFLNAKGGNNRVYGGEGDDSLFSKSGKDRLYGEAGDDFISAGSGNDKVFGGAGNDTIVGGRGKDKLFGDDGDDVIVGSRDSNKIYGGDGNDSLYGGRHVDKIYGEAGDDTIYGGKGNDKLYGLEGDDYIEGGDDLNKIYGGIGDDTLIGGKHTDKIYGEDGKDTLTGGGGKDTLVGGEGDDVYFTDGRDRIIEYSDQGVDTIVVGQSWGLASNFENLDLTGTGNINGSGNSLNNYLWGNSGNNVLSGSAGEDTLDGWLGNDLLVGGDDSDVFLFGLGEDEGEDIILDFNSSEDVLAFDNVIDGAGDDLADIDAQILSIINEGDGGDVVVSFASGTDVTFDNLGSGTAGTLGSIADLVDDPTTQISTASAAGISAGVVTVNLVIDPDDYIVVVD